MGKTYAEYKQGLYNELWAAKDRQCDQLGIARDPHVALGPISKFLLDLLAELKFENVRLQERMNAYEKGSTQKEIEA